MSSKNNKTNIPRKDISTSDQNYQQNMEILSSLKSIPGKVVNLQSENFINEELNKKLTYREGKKTTSSSISKVSKDFFCDQIEEKINNKKNNTANSVFKPMFNPPQKKSTMNYFPNNTLLSIPELCLQNPIGNGPNKITNSSYSKNSFYAMSPNMEQNSNLFDQINFQGNQMNNLSQLNNYNFFNNNLNPINSLNALNILNPTNANYINFYPNSLFLNTTNNLILNKKRNIEDKLEEKPEEKNIKKCIFFKINNSKDKKTHKKNIIINNSFELNNKKNNLFTVIPKSSYNYKKRKPGKKKIFNGNKKKIACCHYGCQATFKTIKQLVYHHYKMNPECQSDTILILKMINYIKNMLIKNNREKNKQKFGELYNETMKNIPLDEHIETLAGFNFEDKIYPDI
jgi:hypothetical protein